MPGGYLARAVIDAKEMSNSVLDPVPDMAYPETQMAKQQIIQLIDDLDGAVLENGEGVSIRFSLEGRSYEIDLSEENATKLRDAFAPFIDAASPVSGNANAGRSRAARGRSAKTDLAEVREWARQQGHNVSERGRVPAAVLEAYAAAH